MATDPWAAFPDAPPSKVAAAAADPWAAFPDAPPSAPMPSAGPVMMDDGTVKPGAAPPSPLVMRFAQDPAVQAAQQIKRGTLAGEAAAFGPMMNQAFHSTLIPSMIDDQKSGAADRAAADTANWRANMLDGGLDQLDPRQRQMAMLDPTLAAQQMGDQPGRPLTNPDEQRQLAQQSIATAIPKEATFGQQQLRDEAIAQAIPSYNTAEGTLGKLFAGASSGTAIGLGNLPAVENLAIPGGRASTLLGTVAKNAVPNAVGAVLTDPLVQANRVSTGMQENYDPLQTGLAGVTGGVLGGTLGGAGHAWDSGKAYLARRNTAPDLTPPGSLADDLFDRTQSVSEQGQSLADDPEFQAQMVQQNTGLDRALPPEASTPAGKMQRTVERKRAESELSKLFDSEANIWPRDQVQVGPEGIEIPEGTQPVRDPTGAQATTDTLAPMREAEALLRKAGIEPDADMMKTVASYQQQGLSPLGAVNAFRRARTMADREGMTPDLERAAGEKANSRQFAKSAFDIAEARRQRREAELDKWEPDLQPDYSAGAGRADDLTPRMAQDLATRLNEPAPGTVSDQPYPRRSVDVIGSKSVGGRRGEYLPGERPAGPQTPPQGRQGDLFEGERTEPRLEGPEETTPPKQPADAPATAGPVKSLGSDDILDRAFAKREQPAAPQERPNYDHLSPDDQRRAVNLDHEIATSKAFGDPLEDIAALQREHDELVNGKAPESAPEAKATETPTEAPAPTGKHAPEVLDALDNELAGTRWDTVGGKLNRDNDGKVTRTKWTSSNPDVHAVLTSYKTTPEQARNLIARSKSGKGKPLTERQQNIVDDLAKALDERKAPRAPRSEPAVKPAKPEPAPKAEPRPKDTADAARVRQLDQEANDAYQEMRKYTHDENGEYRLEKDRPPADRVKIAELHLKSSKAQRDSANLRGVGGRMEDEGVARAEAALKNEQAAAESKAAPKPEEKAPDLELKGQTEAERAASEKDTKAKDKEQADTRKKAEDKAQADKDAKDFKLSGSDRPADVAASHGQGTLLDIMGVPRLAARPVKALFRRLFLGDEHSSMKDTARDLSHATKALFNQEKPTKKGAISNAYRRMLTDTDSSLRSLVKPFKGDIGEQVANQLHVQAGDKGGHGASLDERRQQQVNPRQHAIEDLDNWMRDNKVNTPEAQAQIIKLVENPNTPRRGVLGEAAKKVEDFYKEMHDYQTKAGVELGNVKGYFQRVLDNGMVAGKRGKFLEAAKKAYRQDNPRMTDADAQKAAENYWEREVNGDLVKPGTAHGTSGGATPQHMKARTFSKDAAKHLDDFYVKEIPAMLSTYLHRAVQRAEIAKSGVTIDGKHVPFGDNFKNWEQITDAMRKQDPEISGVLNEFNKLVGTSAGITDSKLGSGSRKVLSGIKTATTLGSMEKSALSSMTELMTPSLRASMGELHDIPQALKAMGEHAYNSVRNAAMGKSGRTNKLQNTFDVAKAAGIVGGSGQHSLMAARASAGDPTSRVQSAMLSKFFGRNGLEDLTNYQRSFATGQSMDFLKRLSAPGRQGKAKTERFLGELGIPVKDQPAFTKFVRDLDGKHATPADLKGPMGDKYKTAMLRFVDQAIQRPSASTRPAWSNDPVGSTIFQLQSFNYAAQKNILNRMFKTMADKDLSVAERGKLAGSFLAHMAAMTGISGAVWEARDKLYSRPDSRQLTTGAKIERALSGAGVFGKFDQPIQSLGSGVKYGASPLTSVIGAGAGNISDLFKIPSDLAGPGNSPNTNTAERKAARTIYQTLGEPALQAAATVLPNSPASMALTAYGIPKAGEKLVDTLMPANKANKKELPPLKGTAETIYDKFTGKDKKPDKGGIQF